MGNTRERLALHLRLLGRAARQAFVDLYNSDVLTHSASIAYYALLSLFPLFLLMLLILGSLTSNPDEREQVVRFVFRYFPRQFDFITGQLDAFQSSTFQFGVGSLLALIWGALGVFSAITSAVNHAWRVDMQRSFLKHRLVSFVMLLSAGGALVIGLGLASVVRMAETRWFGSIAETSPLLQWLSGVSADYAATALLIVCVALVFYYLPNAPVRFRDVWPGAILVGVAWRVALAGFSWYVRDLASWNLIHGSIAAVVVFLIWVYVCAVILLYGVQMTASYSRLQDVAARNPDLGRILGRVSDTWE